MTKRTLFKPIKLEQQDIPDELENREDERDEEEEEDHLEDETKFKNKRRKLENHPTTPATARRFCDRWLTVPEVKGWVHPLRCDPAYVWCKFCKKKIRAHLSDMKVHNKTMKHQRNMSCLRPEIPNDSHMEFEHDVVISFPSSSKLYHEDVIVVQDDGTTAGTTTFSAVSSKEVLNPANLGFVGCGNMAQALLSAFLKKGLVDPPHVIASAPSDRNLSKLRTLGVKTTHNNNEVVKQSDVIFLCVKPHLLTDVIDDLNPPERGHIPLFVSIVTGFDVKALEEMLSALVDRPRVIRTMPNTPCMVGQGCCLYTLGSYTSSADGAVMNSMLSAVGMCAEIPEYQMDAACGLAGSGPAYIYAVIEALADGGVKMGLPRHLAQTLAAQMVKGAATMVLDTGKHPGQLKDEVCSPGGTTIAAVHTLERNGLRNALISAVEASALRSKELGSKSKIKTVSCSKTLS